MGTHPIFESDFDCLTAAMLSRLNPARQTVRVLSLAKSAGGSEVAKSAPAAQWASPEEQTQIAANFQGKQAAAGISAWNVIPDNIADPALKAGLGMIVSFNDFIPQRMAGRCSDAVLEQALNVYNEMKADGAKAWQIRAAVGPIFMEHEKELEAARTDQVPRIRRFNFVVEDLKALYAPQAKKLDGSSYIQGSQLEAVWSWVNTLKTAAPQVDLHGHYADQPLMENQDNLINGIFMKDECWAHTGEPCLAPTHAAWTTSFTLEAEDSAGNKCSIPVSYPINSTMGASRLGFSEETQAALAAATSGAERHEIAAADEKSAYGGVVEILNNVANQAGDHRPNPTSSVFNRIMGTINGEGLPRQQLAKYNADQAEISKFSSWQNEIGVYPAHNSTLSDILNFKSNRHAAKYNTQTVVGKGNFGRVVNCFGGSLIVLMLL